MKKDYPPHGKAGCRSQLWPQATLYDLGMQMGTQGAWVQRSSSWNPWGGGNGAGVSGLECQRCIPRPHSGQRLSLISEKGITPTCHPSSAQFHLPVHQGTLCCFSCC